jgi:predicted outer membrane protein
MKMTTPRLLLLTAAALLPFTGAAATKSKEGGGKGLPPKFGGLIQPLPETPGEPHPGLITSELLGKDLEFLTNTIELGRVQSWLVKMAQEKAETPEVRSLGGALSEIQADENKFVAKLAAAKGVVVPSAGAPVGEEKKISATLTRLSGSKLEKALLEEIVAAAQKSVSQYEVGLKSSDADIKRLAEQMLPAAKGRLQFASKASGRAQDTSDKPNFRTGSTPAPKTAATPPPKAITKPGATPANPKATPPAAAKVAPPGAPPTPAAPEKAAEPVKLPKPGTAVPSVAFPAGTPPPRPPKPTPISQGAAVPKSPTPPDFATPPPPSAK